MRLLETARRAKRILGKPPGYVLRRVLQEGEAELDRFGAPWRERRMNRRRLLAMSRTSSIEQLWGILRTRPFPAVTSPVDSTVLDEIASGESGRVIAAARLACERTIDLLGTGPITLGPSIDWSRDYRVNMGWPSAFARSIDYVNRERPSDVKIPWEISRLQWLIPAGQAYLLTGDEQYALAAQEILSDWMIKNPVAYTVNWSCTMEAALRLFSWTWLFHVFAGSPAWRDEAFRVRFLSCLYLHGDFTLRHIEKADINGNHYTADLAGLVIAGDFFRDIGDAALWRDVGWSGLQQEIVTQVYGDGVDYEASVPYHRLVLELFLWPAMVRQANGEDIPAVYAERLRAMARFTVAYSREDGSSPFWGDADDARALPFGGQKLGDHRYLVGMVAMALDDADLAAQFRGPRSELAWVFGLDRAAAFPSVAAVPAGSAAFGDGGAYIMRQGKTHVFIDCGPIGLAGRGGHGHNDALSFEAWIDGEPVVIDRGSFVYTASFAKRNEYRSTSAHNTPCVDGQEMNRFDPENLWSLQDDARAECTEWRSDASGDFFSGRHRGYHRLGVNVTRQIRLMKDSETLEIEDTIEGQGNHGVAVPLHLAPGVLIEQDGAGVMLRSGRRLFRVAGSDGWAFKMEPTMISPSYGVARPSHRLVWEWNGPLPARLRVVIQAVAPSGGDREDPG